MRIFGPVLCVAILLVLVGCQATDTSIHVDVPKEESTRDQVLSKSVRARLVAEKKLDLTGITVLSKDGTVYLTGVVKSLDARQQALKIAWEVPGVKSVVNSLEVQAK